MVQLLNDFFNTVRLTNVSLLELFCTLRKRAYKMGDQIIGLHVARTTTDTQIHVVQRKTLKNCIPCYSYISIFSSPDSHALQFGYTHLIIDTLLGSSNQKEIFRVV